MNNDPLYLKDAKNQKLAGSIARGGKSAPTASAVKLPPPIQPEPVNIKLPKIDIDSQYTRTPWQVNIPEGKIGNVEVRRFEVPKKSVANMMEMFSGRGTDPGWYTGIYRGNTLWMSDTLAEQRDHWEVDLKIRDRGGRVLIMGLGLGMIVKRALDNPNVTHVDVVELDPDVAALVGPSYAGPRCTIHVADAYEIKWPAGTKWDVAWHDIWPTLSEDNLPEMAKLARSYGRRVGWQGFWGKELLLDHRRRNKDRWSWMNDE
jgi:hypothetical protein